MRCDLEVCVVTDGGCWRYMDTYWQISYAKSLNSLYACLSYLT